MENLINLIKEYGNLENRIGFITGLNMGVKDNDYWELVSKRNEKYTEVQKEIIKLSKELLK